MRPLLRRLALIRTLLAGAAALGAAGRAEAAFTFTFQQQGADVVAIGSGSIDLAGLSFVDDVVLPDSGVSADKAIAGVAGAVAVYAGITGPASFGRGGHSVASIGGGDAVAVTARTAFWASRWATSSGSALSSSMEFAGQTFASIGLSPGTYAWTWRAGSTRTLHGQDRPRCSGACLCADGRGRAHRSRRGAPPPRPASLAEIAGPTHLSTLYMMLFISL